MFVWVVVKTVVNHVFYRRRVFRLQGTPPCGAQFLKAKLVQLQPRVSLA
jgi:hypothetical protein